MRTNFLFPFLLTIGLFLVLTVYPIIFVSQNSFFYKYHFLQNANIQSNDLEKSIQTSNKITDFLFNGNSLPVEIMSERAVVHMFDVRDIYQRAITIPIIVCLFSLIFYYLEGAKITKKILLSGPILAITFYLILGVTGKKVFDFLFIKFHHIFYTNDLWMLDPNDMLIKLYPEEFFSRLIIFSAATTIVISLILVLIFIKKINYATINSNR